MIRAQRDHLALAALPLTVSVEVDGLGPVLFCHATARDDEKIVLVNSPLAWFADAFVGVEERMVVCGHTHMPFDRLADGRRVVNPGSLGMPYGPPGTLAYWALLGPDAILRRTAYDLERAAAVLRQHLVWPSRVHRGEPPERSPSDAEALAIFTRWARERRGL